MVIAGKLVDSGRGYKTFQPNSLQQIEKDLFTIVNEKIK